MPLKRPYLPAHWRTVPPAAVVAVTLLIVTLTALLGYVAGHANSAHPVAVEREPSAAPQGTSRTAQKPVVPQADEKPELAPPAAAPPADLAPTSAGADAKVLTPHALFDKVSPAVALIEVHNGKGEEFALGSGFFVGPPGTLVTNAHVALAEGAAFVVVRLPDETCYFADEVIAADRDADLAVLRLRAKGIPSLELCATPPGVGDQAFAIGNPKGLQNTISEGLVSALRESEKVKGRSCIQTTAAISPGSSGGPLLNARGEVIGVTTYFYVEGQNLNFAMPAALVIALLVQETAPRKIAALSVELKAGEADGAVTTEYVSGEDILRGMKTLRVAVEGLSADANAAGLSEHALQTKMQLTLRSLGLPVVEGAEQQKDDPRSPCLYLNVFVLYSENLELFLYRADLKLLESVTLKPPDAGRITSTIATTWDTPGKVGCAGKTVIADAVEKAVRRMLEEFANDYLAANPK